MLPVITWRDYLTLVAVLLLLYYTALYFLFIKKRQESNRSLPQRKDPAQSASFMQNNADQTKRQELSAITFDFIEDFRQSVHNLPSQVNKENILQTLKVSARKYALLGQASILPAIVELLSTECKQQYSIDIPPDEIANCWR